MNNITTLRITYSKSLRELYQFRVFIYYEQFIVSYRSNHILEFNVLKSLRCGSFYAIFITKRANIAKYLNKCTKISAADCQRAISDVYTKYKTNLDMFIKKRYKINVNDKPIKLLFNYMVRYYKNEEYFEKML